MKKIFYIYIIVLILLAVLPINSTDSALNNNYLLTIRWDYLAHALVYIPLVPMIMIAYGRQHKGMLYRIVIISLSLLFSFSLEGIQYFLSYRAFNINDLIANGLGVILGFFIYLLLPLERLLL